MGVAALLVFIGVAMLSPLIARPAARLLAWPAPLDEEHHRPAGRDNAMRNPRRTASTSAALMIGLALVSFIAIIGASFKDTISSAIDNQINADFVLSPKNFQGFSPEAAAAVRKQLPGSTVVQFRGGQVARQRCLGGRDRREQQLRAGRQPQARGPASTARPMPTAA